MQSKESNLFKNFLIVWFGQFISSIGSGLTAFALGIYVFQLTHSATSYSLIILFAFLPSFILRPIGGTLSDRMDRRLLMIIGDFGSAIGLVFILVMMYLNICNLWLIYIGVSISSVFVALQNPAYKASVTDLLDTELYSKASGLMQLAESSRYLISPIIAGILLGFWDIKNVLIIDILTFFVAISAVFFIKKNISNRTAGNESKSFRSDLTEGFKYTFKRRGLLWLLNITSLITFFIGFLQALFGPMILMFTDSQTLGRALTIMASGMLFSSFLIGIFSKTKRQLLILSVSLSLSGIFYASLGVTTNILFIIVTGFLFFFTLPFINTSLDVLIRKNVENQMQGRVWSIVSLISQLGMVIAFCISGVLADFVFNPLFQHGGLFASGPGKLIGAGPGRGIGFMFFLSGIFIFFIAGVISRLGFIRELDK
jgi:MFS transporter, DHA3 family, macrolide efflux protein